MENLSYVVPVCNEEAGIKITIDALISVLGTAQNINDFEVIIVDDGSTDQTKDNIPRDEKISVITNQKTLGYGASLKKGILASQYNMIGIVDADGTYELQRIPEMLEMMSRADMVVGKRLFLKGATGFTKQLGRKLLNITASYIAGCLIPDTNSGFRLFRRNVFDEALPFIPSGFSFTTTITLIAFFTSKAVRYVPVRYSRRMGEAKIRLVNFFTYVRVLLLLGWRFKPLKIIILGLIVFGILYYIVH